jgi:hypothetical protein
MELPNQSGKRELIKVTDTTCAVTYHKKRYEVVRHFVINPVLESSSESRVNELY